MRPELDRSRRRFTLGNVASAYLMFPATRVVVMDTTRSATCNRRECIYGIVRTFVASLPKSAYLVPAATLSAHAARNLTSPFGPPDGLAAMTNPVSEPPNTRL